MKDRTEVQKSSLDTIEVAGGEFSRKRLDSVDVSFLSATELPQRTNRIPAAVARTVHRFRRTCQEMSRVVAEHEMIQEAAIPGRPEYHINPTRVQWFIGYPFNV